MKEQEINQVLVNLQSISQHTDQSLNYLISEANLKFDQLKILHKKLEIIVALAAQNDIYLKNSLAKHCPECACEDILFDWETGIVKCQAQDCRHHWSVRSGIGADGAYKLT